MHNSTQNVTSPEIATMVRSTYQSRGPATTSIKAFKPTPCWALFAARTFLGAISHLLVIGLVVLGADAAAPARRPAPAV